MPPDIDPDPYFISVGSRMNGLGITLERVASVPVDINDSYGFLGPFLWLLLGGVAPEEVTVTPMASWLP